jgi:DNA-binding response OmpR family regulator
MFILSGEGYWVEIASNVSEGVEVARSSEFGLYLVDLSFSLNSLCRKVFRNNQ